MALKKYKPTTPGRRQMSGYSFDELTTSKPNKKLVTGKNRISGRNNRGTITIRHRGGGAARKYRDTDFKMKKNIGIPGVVESVEYDPGRTAYIMLVLYKNGDRKYHLAPAGITAGESVMTSEKTKIKIGNRLHIGNIPVGYEIHNLEFHPGRGGQAVKSAGNSAKIIGFDGDWAQVQLPSKEIRMVNKECYASIGKVSNTDHSLIKIGKAGRKRHMGRRPQVRGKAMNPCDHPHGGGEGACPIGMKHPKTPWGLPALGKKTRRRKDTNRLIVKNRKGKMVR
ncbi:MAG: 50S ribosomal protein L2 [Candidatus Gracilibacteria bacterium]|nr:50S ribosomal protein L2 [Candidatus Gracilibacteria bacterium]